MRFVCALQGDPLLVAGHRGRTLWRQHGARDVQHRTRREDPWSRMDTRSTMRTTTRREDAFITTIPGPCCSGSLPQVAADYRILTYFRAPQAVYVNLYIPSTVQWTEGSAQLSLTQTGNYPLDSQVAFEVTATQPTELTLHFRIPQWAEGASLRVNGKRTDVQVAPGSFAGVSRTWKNGDRVELELPLTLRVEAVDAQHPDLLALVRGPLVLFAVTEAAPAVTRQQVAGGAADERAGVAGRHDARPDEADALHGAG